MSKTLTTGQIAKYCGVHYRTVLRWIESNRLSAFKLPGGGHHRIKTDAFLHFLTENNMPVPKELCLSTKTILIVEDDKPMAKAIERILLKEGYNIVIAHDGFKAGTMLCTLRPAIMTLDLNIPGVDGFQILKFIRENNDLKNTKVVVISGSQDKILNETLDIGAHCVLAKPFINDELSNTVKQLIA